MLTRTAILAGLIALAAKPSEGKEPRPDPPRFHLSASPPFILLDRVERYRAGDVTYRDGSFRFVTTASVTRRYGDFGTRPKEQFPKTHGWSVSVYATFSEKVAAAYASTKDGYQPRITDGVKLETSDWGSYMVARLRRKQFRWGHAVSFLSQGTQDMLLDAPANGRLTYEVWGVTADQKHTVIARISVSHPKLPDYGDRTKPPRAYRTVESVKKDPDYKRIERCKSEEFTPSLTAFDEMLGSLTIR